VIVRGTAGAHSLEQSFRPGLEWPLEAKRHIIGRGRELLDAELRAQGLDS
jgi:hypothetical protein